MAGTFRFAPSPNGRLHLGHAFSALLNQSLARRMGARLLLRIEDIDPARSRREFTDAIFDDLRWLGFSWDGAVRHQSAHMADYSAHIETLRARGLLYPCFCSRTEIARASADRADHLRDPDGAPLYPGTCRALDPALAAARIAAGEPHVLRLDMARALAAIEKPLDWQEWDGTDGITRIPADPAAWGDVVLARRDVPTSYHLSVVADDAVQGISHVVRGRDLYHATSVHRLLQTLLYLPEPLYHHHTLLLDAQGRKLAKSAGSPAIADLRAQGANPADIVARLGPEIRASG
jgi:glutamyl-Q tRNA(Asp) synthetase